MCTIMNMRHKQKSGGIGKNVANMIEFAREAYKLDKDAEPAQVLATVLLKMKEAAREQQAKQQKDKQDYDNEKKFYDGLSDIKLDLYEKDVPFINGKIDEIIKKVADEKMAAETHLISAIQMHM